MSDSPVVQDDGARSFPMLAAALAREDVAAVAFALRNGRVVVPLLPGSVAGASFGPGASEAQVRVFRRGDADRYMLLLFSSAETYAAMVPEESVLPSAAYDGATLLDFLVQNEGVLESVWFDVAGPHSMQAVPADVIAALRLPRES